MFLFFPASTFFIFFEAKPYDITQIFIVRVINKNKILTSNQIVATGLS